MMSGGPARLSSAGRFALAMLKLGLPGTKCDGGFARLSAQALLSPLAVKASFDVVSCDYGDSFDIGPLEKTPWTAPRL